MTKPEDYAPYHELSEFWEGYRDYNAGTQRTYEGVRGQAYDRGQEFAMRQRQDAMSAFVDGSY